MRQTVRRNGGFAPLTKGPGENEPGFGVDPHNGHASRRFSPNGHHKNFSREEK
jgi:hypothetical protein